MLCRSRKISPNRRRCEIPGHHSRGHDPPAPSGCPRWPRISFSVSRAQQRAGRGGFADLFDSPCLYPGHPLPGPHCVILYARSDALALLSAHPVLGSPEPYRRSHPAGTRVFFQLRWLLEPVALHHPSTSGKHAQLQPTHLRISHHPFPIRRATSAHTAPGEFPRFHFLSWCPRVGRVLAFRVALFRPFRDNSEVPITYSSSRIHPPRLHATRRLSCLLTSVRTGLLDT